jgi:hypothetical protein
VDRTLLYKIMTVDGVDELDYLSNTLSNFRMTYPTSVYTVVESDLGRPDLISYSVYGSVGYWWLILLVNDVIDPFNGLTVGQELIIPSLLDVYEFQRSNRLR